VIKSSEAWNSEPLLEKRLGVSPHCQFGDGQPVALPVFANLEEIFAFPGQESYGAADRRGVPQMVSAIGIPEIPSSTIPLLIIRSSARRHFRRPYELV